MQTTNKILDNGNKENVVSSDREYLKNEIKNLIDTYNKSSDEFEREIIFGKTIDYLGQLGITDPDSYSDVKALRRIFEVNRSSYKKDLQNSSKTIESNNPVLEKNKIKYESSAPSLTKFDSKELECLCDEYVSASDHFKCKKSASKYRDEVFGAIELDLIKFGLYSEKSVKLLKSHLDGKVERVQAVKDHYIRSVRRLGNIVRELDIFLIKHRCGDI